MMRSSLVAVVAARLFQAPSPGSVPVSAPTASYAVPNVAPVYGFEQASAFPSVPVAAASVPVSTSTSSSKSAATSLLAGAALGATVAVLFGSGKKSAPKPKAAAKKPAPKPKAAAKKPAPKPTVARKPVTTVRRSFGKSPVGKGGLLPWVTNEPGTYAKPLMLSSLDFTSDDSDALIGWGAMPDSVKALYNPTGRKGLFGGCITPARR